MMRRKDISSIDFSQRSVNRIVLRKSLNHPVTVYPATIGIVAVAAILILDLPASFFVFAASCGAISFCGWILNKYVRGQHIAFEHTKMLRQLLHNQVDAVLASLESELKELGAEQGVEQLKKLKEKFDNLEHVLKVQLNEGELTYGRYLGTAEQVYTGAVNRLKEIAVVLRSIHTIDVKGVTNHIKLLESGANKSEDTEREIAALRERLALHTAMEQKVRDFLTTNEVAMTALDNTAVAIAQIGSADGVTLEDSMLELAELARRASKYSVIK